MFRHRAYNLESINRTIFIEKNNKEIGKVYIGCTPNNFPCISSLYVDEAYRKLGHGTKLIDEACRIALPFGFNEVKLFVAIDNESMLIDFYRRLGFELRENFDRTREMFKKLN